MNQYQAAVNLIEEYIVATDTVFEDGDLNDVEGKLHLALKVLKEQEAYGRITSQ